MHSLTRALRTGLALLLLATLSSPIRADTFYVDAVHGSNANSGTSWDDAWRTISHAVANSGGGGVFQIGPGTYDAALGETFPIDMKHRYFVGVAGAERTIVDGGGAGVLFGGDGSATLEGLWLRNGGTGVDFGLLCFMLNCTPQVTLRGVIVSNMGVGVRGYIWTDWEDVTLIVNLERVIVEQCGMAAEIIAHADPNNPSHIPLAESSLQCSDSLIRENQVGLSGWSFGGSYHVAEIHALRCTFAGNGGHAISTDASNVRSSILFGNGADIGGATTVQYSNTEHSTYPGTGNISTDPLFHDPSAGDYRLRFGSPSADAGDPALTEGLDLLGTARPLDGDLNTERRTDMGALELAPLAFHGEARIGTTVDLELWGPAAGSATVFWRRGETEPAIPTPYGAWLLGRPRVVFGIGGTEPGPPSLFPFSIPADPSLVGLSISFQALSPSSLAWPPVALTSAITLTLLP